MIPIKGRLERYKRIFYTFYNYKRHKSVLGINLFLGGESLLHKEISNMIVYARSEGKNFRIKSSSYTPCMFLWYSMSILWDGRVVPCCIDFKGEYILGEGSVVAAGAVVTQSVPAWKVAAGCPARIIKERPSMERVNNKEVRKVE